MDRPRLHHDIGGVPRSVRGQVDTDLHAQVDQEAGALRRILRGGRLVSVDEGGRFIDAVSAAGDHRRANEGAGSVALGATSRVPQPSRCPDLPRRRAA